MCALLVALLGAAVYYIVNRKKVNSTVASTVKNAYFDQLAKEDAELKSLWNSGQFKN